MALDGPQRLGIVGAGVMGSAIATRLIESGASVTVSDLDPAKVAALVARGAHAGGAPATLWERADVVITSLNTAGIVRQVVLGGGGLADTATADRLIIDMSSIDPQATREIARDFRARTGAGFVDAPLSGGAPGALTGRLTLMAGGEEHDIARAKTVLAPLFANFTAMGPSGAGQATKLVNQILCAIGFVAVAEAVKFAEDSGVDAALIPQALAGGRADSRILQEFLGKMSRRDYTPTGRLDNMLKDLEAVQAVALQTRTPMPVTGLVADLHRLLVRMGHGASDTAALMALFEPTTPQN